MVSLLLLAGLAQAELPAPSYRDTLDAGAAAKTAQLARDAGMDAARDFAQQWAKELGPSAAVAYELGLGFRLAGNDAEARRWLDRAIELSPSHVAARYDRGELRLNAGDLDGAQADFEEVVRLAPRQWAGHFRLADIAGRRGDAATQVAFLQDALRTGFRFQSLVGDPRWQTWLADDTLGPGLRSLMLEYEGPEVVEAIERGR